MRRVLSGLLWVAFLMVQDRPMPVSITLRDGHHYTVDVPEGSDPDTEIERIKTGHGEYSKGWVVERGGTHIRIDEIKMMRAFEGQAATAN